MDCNRTTAENELLQYASKETAGKPSGATSAPDTWRTTMQSCEQSAMHSPDH